MPIMRPVLCVTGFRRLSFSCCRSDNSNAKPFDGDGHGTRAKHFLESRAITAARRLNDVAGFASNRPTEDLYEKSNAAQ